jgi:hypothetical protein
MIFPGTVRAGAHGVKPFGQAQNGARFDDIDVIRKQSDIALRGLK